uniref:Muscrinic acethylcholine receptor-like GPCR protein n=1 Tax=Polyphagotarsonemus latus TaxID=1204166 RepID=A0AAN0N7A8_9ACAR
MALQFFTSLPTTSYFLQNPINCFLKFKNERLNNTSLNENFIFASINSTQKLNSFLSESKILPSYNQNSDDSCEKLINLFEKRRIKKRKKRKIVKKATSLKSNQRSNISLIKNINLNKKIEKRSINFNSSIYTSNYSNIGHKNNFGENFLEIVQLPKKITTYLEKRQNNVYKSLKQNFSKNIKEYIHKDNITSLNTDNKKEDNFRINLKNSLDNLENDIQLNESSSIDSSHFVNNSNKDFVNSKDDFKTKLPKINIFYFVLFTVLAVFLSLITIIGNMLVMISLVIDRQLRTISNYFLLSLSIADFLIGLISMPLYTIYLLLGKWPLGPIVCDAWLALDYLNCNASIFNLLVISFDRYYSVTRPLTYRVQRTKKRAFIIIAFTWIISLLLWDPWIYLWPYIEGKRTVPDDDCYVQFLKSNPYITFVTAIAAFYLPVTVMIILYFRIWRETQQRYKDITTLFLVSTAGGKVIKSKNKSKIDSNTIDNTNKISKCQMLNLNEELKDVSNKEKNNEINKLNQKKPISFWRKFCTFNESIQSQSTIVNKSSEKKEETNSKNFLTIDYSSYSIDKNQDNEKTDDIENQELRCHADNEDLENEKKISTENKTSTDSIYTILIKLHQVDSETGPSIKMLESQVNSSEKSNNTKIKENLQQSDTNNNQHNETEPLTIANGLKKENFYNNIMKIDSTLDAESVTSGSVLKNIYPTQQTSSIRNTTIGINTPLQPKSERKAAKTLSAILLAFIFTWTPYNVVALLNSLLVNKDNLEEDFIPKPIWLFSYYLCYINSTVNPLCYALCNASFRRTYIRILKCKWTKSKRSAAASQRYLNEKRHLNESKTKYRHWMT